MAHNILMAKRSRLFEELVLKSWWTILFFLICFFAYDQAAKRRVREEEKLRDKLEQLLLAKEEALAIQEEFKRDIRSQSDERWIELLLMQKLGLVPEGQIKVHFVKKNRVPP
jgi:cbb3-type cytochrome oxidase subunit 3